MDRTATGLAVVALAVGGAGLWLALDAGERAGTAEVAAGRARSDLAAAEARIEEARRAAESADAGRRAAEERLSAVEVGLGSLAERSAPGGGTGGPGGGPASAAGAPGALLPGAAVKKSVADPARVTEFKRLRDAYFEGKLDDKEQERYWELAKAEGFLDAVIGEMETAVEASPEDMALRMELSRDYISRLYTVPAGPEMGVWAAKAETQWKEVLARDDRHWEARLSLATSWARYPDFLNKGPDAIRELETLRRQQESGPVEARQAQVYMELGNLYKRAGNPEKQRAALEEGRRRHSDDETLRKALDVLGPR